MDWQKLPLATITIAILFMCGGLYLVGFWSTFNLNVASFISFTDIPKSFILPLISTFGFFFIYTLSNLIYDFYDSEESTLTKINYNPTKWQRFLRKIKKPEFILYLCMSLSLYFYGATIGL